MSNPLAMGTDLSDGMIDTFTLLDIERERLRFEVTPVEFASSITLRKVGRFVPIVKAIDRSALVTMQPRAIATEGD